MNNRTKVLVLLFLAIIAEVATIVSTLLFANGTFLPSLWWIMGFINWSEFIFFIYAIYSINNRRISGATKAIVGSLLGLYCLSGLVTILIYNRYFDLSSNYMPLIAYLLAETTIVLILSIIIIINDDNNEKERYDTKKLKINKLVNDIEQFKIKLMLIRSSLPEYLTIFANIEKQLDIICSKLTHMSVSRENAPLITNFSETILRFNALLEAKKSSGEKSKMVESIKEQVDDLLASMNQ